MRGARAVIVIICFGFYSYAYFSNIVNYEQVPPSPFFIRVFQH